MGLKLYSLVLCHLLIFMTGGVEVVEGQQRVSAAFRDLLSTSQGIIRSPFNFLQQVGQVGTGVLDGTIGANVLDQVLRQLIEMVRKGLLHADVGNLTLPAVDWTINSPALNGALHTMDARILGLTNFAMRNVSSSLTQLNVDIDLVAPLIQVQGKYIADLKFLSFPITGSGTFSVKFSNLEVGGDGHFKGLDVASFGSGASIEISNPFVGLGGVDITLDGLPSDMYCTNLVLIVIASLLVYTIIVILGTLFSRSVVEKIRQRPLGFEEVDVK